jgi:hypothetical protein
MPLGAQCLGKTVCDDRGRPGPGYLYSPLGYLLPQPVVMNIHMPELDNESLDDKSSDRLHVVALYGYFMIQMKFNAFEKAISS